jgi:hypothetical protein
MAIDYVRMAATATRLLTENGKASVFIRATPTASSDPVAGTVTPGTAVDTSVAAVEIKYNEAYQPGALIQAGDRMYALDAAPGLEDALLIDAALWEIVQVWPKKPGDTLVAAFAQVRA